MLESIKKSYIVLFSIAFLFVGSNSYSEINSLLIPKKELLNNKAFQTLDNHSDDVNAVAVSPDGNIVATASKDESVLLWNIDSGEILKTLTGHSGAVLSVSFSSDGSFIASGSKDKTAIIWNKDSGKVLNTFKNGGSIYSVAFSPNGKYLATGSFDGTAKLWNLNSVESSRTLTSHSLAVTSVAYSSDGKTIATGSRDGSAKLWNVVKGTLIKTLSGHSGWVNSVAFSPDGKTLATASKDKSIIIWNVASGEVIKTLTGHSSWVNSVTFSPDGKTLATGSWDNMVKVWNVSTGLATKELASHSDGVSSVVFIPTGKMLVTGSADNSAKLWHVQGDYESLFGNIKRGKFEKTNDFNKRLAIEKSKTMPYVFNAKLHSYDPDSESYKVNISGEEYSVSVPLSKAETIDNDLKVKIEGFVRYYDEDNAELVKPVVYHKGANFKSRILGLKSSPLKYYTKKSTSRRNSQSASDSEALFWSSIEFSRNPDDFKAYLKQYPDGVFVSLAESKASQFTKAIKKETLVLMPIKTSGVAKNMRGSMESAVVEGLNKKYKVYAGSQVRRKVTEIFTKESQRVGAGKKCDEAICMQNIALAFNTDIIATTRVIKNKDGFVLSIDVRNIFDDVSVYSKSMPCKRCDEFQVIEKLKTLVK